MTTYAKLNDGALEVLRRVPHHSNPSEATIKAYAEANGYKTYVKVKQPEGLYHHSYKETAKRITDVWTEYSDSEKAPYRVAELKQRLADTDYVAAKLAEVDGEERTQMLADYAEVRANRQSWREEIRSLQNGTTDETSTETES